MKKLKYNLIDITINIQSLFNKSIYFYLYVTRIATDKLLLRILVTRNHNAPLRRRKFSFQRASFWGLKTRKNRWNPHLENTVDAEAIGSPIHAILPSVSLICETVHCLDETALSSFSSNGPFSRDFMLQTLQQCYVIVAVYCFSLFKIVDEYYTMRIPKYG